MVCASRERNYTAACREGTGYHDRVGESFRENRERRDGRHSCVYRGARLDRPDSERVAIEGIAGLPKHVPIPSIKFPRHFQDSNLVRLGGEYTFKLWGYPMDLRTGMSFKTSAIPRPYLSLLTIDMDKITLAVGGGLHIGEHWRFDLTYAHLFASSVDVPPAEAKIPRVNRSRATPRSRL